MQKISTQSSTNFLQNLVFRLTSQKMDIFAVNLIQPN